MTVQELIACRRQQAAVSTSQFLFGASGMMAQLREDVAAASRADVNVLIVGEAGVGKQIIARTIHDAGSRRPQPFVTVSCASIPDSLLESELFGHVRGSFAGAYRDKPGLTAQGDRGTLFVDEIADMSRRVQALFLRFVETGTVTPTGSSGHERRTNVRIVTAASRSLAHAIAAGDFREDLYYRLNVIRLTIPPLRERGDDICALLRHHLGERAKAHGVGTPQLSAGAANILSVYHWPGNVRELTNVVERLVIRRVERDVAVEDLPPEILSATTYTSR
ncbi:MAG TPA: sigma 54-interacting transcriptional regulator [Vicinamibacterales bacterium]